MSEQQLWNPKRFTLPGALILTPCFWSRDYYRLLKEKAERVFPTLTSEIVIYPDYSIIAGFLGYPHILTLLELVEDVREKEIFFLGTAGSLTEKYDRHMTVLVEEISGSGLLEHFSEQQTFSMRKERFPGVVGAKGVTVDIIQRETPSWLNLQQQKGMDFVEMEIFAIRAWLGRPFNALVTLTDRLTGDGVRVFRGLKSLEREFVAAFERITGLFGTVNGRHDSAGAGSTLEKQGG